MKNTLLSIFTFFIAFCGYGQNLIEEQLPDNSGAGFFTGAYLQTAEALYLADDFVLSEPKSIGQITFYGYSLVDIDQVLSGFKLYIYTDDNGQPQGNPKQTQNENLVLNLNSGDSGLTVDKVVSNGVYHYNFTVDFDELYGHGYNLTQGHYWLLPIPQLDIVFDPATENRIWFWRASTEAQYEHPAIIDFTDMMDFDIWSDFTTNIDLEGQNPIYAFAFSVVESGLGVKTQVKKPTIQIYPTLVKTNFYLQMEHPQQFLGACLLNSLGQVVEEDLRYGENNVSNLTSGLYFISTQTTKGTQINRIIIQ